MRLWQAFLLLLHAVAAIISTSTGFKNCLNPVPGQKLLYTPTNVTASFNAPDYVLNIVVQGQMAGTLQNVNVDTNTLSTLIVTVNTLQYRTYRTALPLCNYTTCPFTGNDTLIQVSIPLGSSYQFTTLETTLNIIDPSTKALSVGCVDIPLTPVLGSTLKNMLTFVPVGILLAVAIATIVACIYNPWTGTANIFKWSSNYGFDPDTLRLVTPGPTDVVNHLQFIFFSGALSLDYPGFYQPVVSNIAWSSLAFNTSLVSKDSVTFQNGLYTEGLPEVGMQTLMETVGIPTPEDLWAIFIIAFVSFVAGLVLLSEIYIIFNLISTKDSWRNLKRKNPAYAFGILVRCLLNVFIFPLVTISLFQLVSAPGISVVVTAFCAIVLAFTFLFGVFVLRKIAVHWPRPALYDDINILLIYGGLYNTFLEPAAIFAAFTVLNMVLRGILIGVAQASGTAQVVLLSILEVVFLIALNIFRPHHPISHMNGFQSVFSISRLLTWLFFITYIPSLNVSQAVRGWIGYAVLLIHGFVLVFAFFLNAVSTLIEIVARLAGAGDSTSRGGLGRVFGIHQLSRRQEAYDRPSLSSSAVLLGDRSTLGPTPTPTPTPYFRPPRRPTFSYAGDDARPSPVRTMLRQTPRESYFDEWLDDDQSVKRKDYAVRESDIYYHGPQQPLSQQSGRRIGTGPADPNSAVAGVKRFMNRWLRKREEPAFEVIRNPRSFGGTIDEGDDMPARSTISIDQPPAERASFSGSGASFDCSRVTLPMEKTRSKSILGRPESFFEHADEHDNLQDVDIAEGEAVAEQNPPILPKVDLGDIHLSPQEYFSKLPKVPRKSSRRKTLSSASTPDVSSFLQQPVASAQLPYQQLREGSISSASPIVAVFPSSEGHRGSVGSVGRSVEGAWSGPSLDEPRYCSDDMSASSSTAPRGSTETPQRGSVYRLSRDERMGMSLYDIRQFVGQSNEPGRRDSGEGLSPYAPSEHRQSFARPHDPAGQVTPPSQEHRSQARRSKDMLGFEI